jgi:hypothetical protein
MSKHIADFRKNQTGVMMDLASRTGILFEEAGEAVPVAAVRQILSAVTFHRCSMLPSSLPSQFAIRVPFRIAVLLA